MMPPALLTRQAANVALHRAITVAGDIDNPHHAQQIGHVAAFLQTLLQADLLPDAGETMSGRRDRS